MSEEFKIYLNVLTAINRAEFLGFKVTCYSNKICMKNKNGKPSFPFYNGNEIHAYLNGYEDGTNN
jgi:hypothetical protein